MDSNPEKDEDEDDLTRVQKPMQAYSRADDIKLPELLLNDNVRTSFYFPA